MKWVLLGAAVFAAVVTYTLLNVAVTVYNGLVALRAQVDRAWANIDVLLKQRFDELPSLISICEQYAQHERGVLDRLAQARENYGRATTLNQKVQASRELTGAISGLLALGEAYPDLKSSSQFAQIQQRISALEDQIADRREMFNESVTIFNTRIQQFPDMLFVPSLGYSQLELYRVEPAETKIPNLKMKLAA